MNPDAGTAAASREVAPEPSAALEPALEVREGGMRVSRIADPCILVIFGASGDLARRELVPSLYELFCKELLPERFAVLGMSRSDWDDGRFREEVRRPVRAQCIWSERVWREFADRLYYLPGDASEQGDLDRLRTRIERVREDRGVPPNLAFHFAVPPLFFGPIARGLGRAGLARSEEGWRRLVVEKPFGTDLRSARELDRTLRGIFDEEQIYRIDHFLGKETVQNMLVFRFGNPGWEPIWNRDHIDHVQITVAEDLGIGTRAGFYEETGVVRDMVQNHLLQLLCMAAIEPPVSFDGQSLRDETVKVLRAVNTAPVDPERDVVLGQYGSGLVGDEQASAYRDERGVAADSTTPTFAALRLTVDNWRWAGVPFYLRTGKRMARKLTEVAIQFKPTPHAMFPRQEDGPPRHNLLAFRLQPEEGIVRTFLAKQPGPELSMRQVRMNFRYAEAFGIEEPPRAYAWLLLDVMQGQQTLFARAEWIEEAWKAVDPIVARHQDGETPPFPNYAAGSWGPVEAHALIAREGREWRAL